MKKMNTFKQSEPARFDADPALLLESKLVVFPITISVRRSAFTDAFAITRDTISKVNTEIKSLNVGEIDIKSDRIRFDDEPKGTVLAQTSCTLHIKLGANDVWGMVEAVAKILDVINRYSAPGGAGKEVQIYAASTNVAPPK